MELMAAGCSAAAMVGSVHMSASRRPTHPSSAVCSSARASASQSGEKQRYESQRKEVATPLCSCARCRIAEWVDASNVLQGVEVDLLLQVQHARALAAML